MKEERERGKGDRVREEKEWASPFAQGVQVRLSKIQSFVGLLTSENKIWAVAEEQAVRPRGQSSPFWLRYVPKLFKPQI